MATANSATAPTPRALPRPGLRENVRLTRQMLSTPTRALDTIAERHGGTCSLGFGPLRMAIIGSPPAIREVMSRRADAYVWGHHFQSVGPSAFVGKRSMLGSDGADHSRRRGAVQAAFNRQRINRWAPMILQRTDAAIDEIVAAARPGQPIDLYPFGRRLILGITLQALFGDRWSSRLDEVHALVLRAQRFLELPAVRQLPLPIPVGSRAGVRRDRRILDEMIDADLALVRSQPPGSMDGLLGTLAFADDLSDEEIRDQVVTLIGAGFDTTASTLSWAIARIARAPEVGSALRAEADRAAAPGDADGDDAPHGGHTGPASTDDSPARWAVGALAYTGRVVREVLRLHPAGVLGVRMAAADMEIDGQAITKRTMVAWSPYISGRDPSVWPDPLRFDPDRYLDANLDEAQHTQTELAWIPFGRGPHMCIGFALAQLELTLIVGRLAQRCDLTAANDVMPSPSGLIVNRPTGGAVVLLSARDSA